MVKWLLTEFGDMRDLKKLTTSLEKQNIPYKTIKWGDPFMDKYPYKYDDEPVVFYGSINVTKRVNDNKDYTGALLKSL